MDKNGHHHSVFSTMYATRTKKMLLILKQKQPAAAFEGKWNILLSPPQNVVSHTW
jgi:hypothetical protein